ncbi:uncharacterized protein LOC143471047 [Clavelina lepadiformis]|uniref:uncharacterized protein LOC143471047 n=1 Tax=Clavelina lepadiformis TaxID=159417 RepID=UPI004041044C
MAEIIVEMEPNNKDELERQLQSAKQASTQKLANDFNSAQSAYELQESGQPDSFCSETISWYNPYIRHFHTFSCVFITACLYLVSYMFFFNASLTIYVVSSSADFLYVYVMVLRSRTGHMIDGVEERNLLKIRQRYQKSIGFFLDLLTMMPFSQLRLFFPGSDEIFYAIGRQRMYVRLHYILYYLGIREEEPGSSTLFFRTTKYALLSSLTIHFAACGWYGLACSRSDESGFSLRLCSGNSWIMYLPQNILEKVLSATDNPDQALNSEVSFLHNTYITSLYWASATATSTGYGDIHAYTIPEKFYSIGAMIVGMTILYGMTMGGMTSMLTNIDARRSSFVHRYKAFEKEVEKMGIRDNIKELCLKYFDYLWHRYEGENVQASGVLEILPESLRASFAEATFYKLLHKADLLEATEDAFCRNLALVSKPMIFLENQFIQKSGEIANNMCYIQQGVVEVLDASEEEVVAVMHSGKLFGQILLVFDLPRINSIKCKTNCDIFMLNKHDFRQVLSDYPEAARVFVKAAREKCLGPQPQWPMNPPTFDEFSNFIEKTSKSKRRVSMISTTSTDTSAARPTTAMMGRRMTTVYATNYDGVDLSRVPMHKTERTNLEQTVSSDEPKPSLVDFVIRGDQTKVRRRSSTMVHDGTEMIAANANYEDLKDAVGPQAQYKDPDVTTWKERLFNLTIIDPKGKFYAFWLNFLFCTSLFAGLYTTFMAFFATTPGMEKSYTGEDATSLDLLAISSDTCDQAEKALYADCSLATFESTADCIINANGTFSSRVTKSTSNVYTVVVPSWYDTSHVSYNPNTDEGRLNIFLSYFLIDLFFYVNIFINFRTEVLTPNGFLTSFKDISANYNKWNKLWLDVMAVFPLEIFAPVIGCSWKATYDAMKFLRLNRVLYFFRYVPTAFTRWEYSLDVEIVRIRTLKFVVYIYTFTHMCSCFYFWWSCGYVHQSSLSEILYKCRFGSWAWVFDITHQTSRGADYIKTMYWASTTMTSTGYGDISASTTTGRMFALITMIIGTVMYGWLVAVIASTVSNSEAAEVSFHNSMLATKEYLLVHAVPKALVNRVMDVRRIEWERYGGTATPGEQTIGRELSDQLRSVLMYESINKFAQGLPFFHGVDPSFVAMLCNHVMTYHYSEGDVIIYEGDLSRNLYIIKRGHCDIVAEDLGEVIDHLTPGDYFGEVEILFGCGSPRTVVADTACEVLVLQRSDIDDVLQSFPVLQIQMQKIEEDTSYRDRVLHAIKSRNTNYRMGINMFKRYEVAVISGGTQLFAERCRLAALTLPLDKCDRKLKESYSAFRKFISMLLLPMTFDPLSRPYILYETIRLVLSFATIVIVPLQFAIFPSSAGMMTFQYILDGLCLVDQYVKAHTAYFNKESVLVTHPYHTARHYLQTSFTVDLISWFPFELIVYGLLAAPHSQQQWKLVAIFRISRVLQIYKIFSYFSFWLSDIRTENRWIKHLSSILYGFLIHHWFACLLFVSACVPETVNNDALYSTMPEMVEFNGAGKVMYCHNTTWIGSIAASDTFPSLDVVHSLWDQYIVSFYWATATLVCVGYGDIHARMLGEMFMATVVMIMGTVYYSSILGDISANIQTDDIRRGHYKGRLSDILKFFKVYDVTKDTQRQVLDYYCYLWDRTQGVSPADLLTGLPPSIRTSVCQSMYDVMIREAFDEGSDIDKETQGFFRLVSTHIKPAFYLKQSIICRRGDIGDEMFFIQRGNVAILEEDDETITKVLGPGQHFGEIALLFATPRSRTIKAMTNCDLNVLGKTDLDDILNKFPRFRERMTAIAQDRKLQGTRSLTYNHQPSDAALQAGSLFNPDGTRRDGTDKQKFTKVMDRESKFSLIWNHLTVILAFLSALLCIYQACFYNHRSIFYILGYLMDVWFALDMIISFHSSYVDQFSTNVDDQTKIHNRYAKTPTRFMLDALANVPFDLLAHVVGSNVGIQLAVLSYCRLNRVLRMYRMLTIFRQWENDIRKDVLVVRMYKFLLGLGFTVSSVASIWYAIACPNSVCQPISWAAASVTDYANNNVFGHHALPYVDSLYWAVATMTSTGYGDIKPETQSEMIYGCVVMVLGKLMLGYVLGMVAATLANDESLRVWYEQNVTSVKHYMVDLKFEGELFEHVIQYYDYMWMKNQGVNVMDLFPDLSFSLRADIYNQICREMVDSIELFEGCPENFLRHLCMAMVPTAYMPGDYICLQGDIRSELYVIRHGVAEAIKRDGNEKIPIRLVTEGESFLTESVLCKVRRPCSLRARTYVDVFSMSMEGLQNILNYHPTIRPIVLANARRLYPDLQL